SLSSETASIFTNSRELFLKCRSQNISTTQLSLLFSLYSFNSLNFIIFLFALKDYPYDSLFSVASKINFELVNPLTLSEINFFFLSVFIKTFMFVFFMPAVNRLTPQIKFLPPLITGAIVFSNCIFGALTFKKLLPILFAAVVYTIGEMIYIPANQVRRVKMMDDNK
ncbi:hypothetical protein ACEF17_13340, partial [Streptococcus hyovaginalis]